MKFNATVHTPMYEFNEKKYLRVFVSDTTRELIIRHHSRMELNGDHVDNPLEGNILTVKVPFRYRRVTCRFEGAPVQSLKRNDEIRVDVEFMGRWNVGTAYCGYTWKLNYIKLLDPVIL